MKTDQHNPAPWVIADDCDPMEDELYIRDAEDFVVCAVWPMDTDARNDPKSKANAALIAAAPELLAALAALVAEVHSTNDDKEETRNAFESLRPAEAALKRAKA